MNTTDCARSLHPYYLDKTVRFWDKTLSPTRISTEDLNKYIHSRVQIPRVRMEEHQEIETLISETLLFAQYLRDEKPTWHPRTVALS